MRFYNVSIFAIFMDTFFGHVHGVDMNILTQAIAKVSQTIWANVGETGYGR